MKKITLLLFYLVTLCVSANVTINVRTTTGDAPFLYAWDGSGTALNGAWPGTLMDATQTYTTTVDGKVWFTQTFDAEAINIIFNDGGDPAVQTATSWVLPRQLFMFLIPKKVNMKMLPAPILLPQVLM